MSSFGQQTGTPVSSKRTAAVLTPPELETKHIKSGNMNAEAIPVITSGGSQQTPGQKVEFNFQFTTETPGWAITLFNSVKTQFEKVCSDLADSIESASSVANSATQQTLNLTTQLHRLKQENTSLKFNMSLLRDRCGLLEQKLSSIEDRSRRDNLVIEGLAENKNENCEAIAKTFIKDNLQVEGADNIDLTRVHRIGSISTETSQQGGQPPKPRPLIMNFQQHKQRQSTWNNRKNLAGTNFSLKENFSRDTEEDRKLMYPIVKKAKALVEYKGKVFIKVNKLVYNKKEYSADELETLPEALRPSTIATQSQNGVIAFYGKGSPLSNFSECSFEENGITFHCIALHGAILHTPQGKTSECPRSGQEGSNLQTPK